MPPPTAVSPVYIPGVIESDLHRTIAELDCADCFKGPQEVEALRYTPAKQAWARVRRAEEMLSRLERDAQEQPELF